VSDWPPDTRDSAKAIAPGRAHVPRFNVTAAFCGNRPFVVTLTRALEPEPKMVADPIDRVFVPVPCKRTTNGLSSAAAGPWQYTTPAPRKSTMRPLRLAMARETPRKITRTVIFAVARSFRGGRHYSTRSCDANVAPLRRTEDDNVEHRNHLAIVSVARRVSSTTAR
jgi:hypothetical protein